MSNVIDMSCMFAVALSFNQDVSDWDVFKVTDMSKMFYYASLFDQVMSEWDVSNVTNMRKCFQVQHHSIKM